LYSLPDSVNETLVGGERLFTSKTYDVHKATIEHINATPCRFFDPVDMPLYAAKTQLKNGLTAWRCSRGTSQLEAGSPQHNDSVTSVFIYHVIHRISHPVLLNVTI
jgi:hypothetical protein